MTRFRIEMSEHGGPFINCPIGRITSQAEAAQCVKDCWRQDGLTLKKGFQFKLIKVTEKPTFKRTGNRIRISQITKNEEVVGFL